MKFEITSSPVAALYGTLVCGAERDDAGDLKVYVDSRHRGLYVVVPAGDMADPIEAAWHGTSQHLYMTPIPPSEALFCDQQEAPA